MCPEDALSASVHCPQHKADPTHSLTPEQVVFPFSNRALHIRASGWFAHCCTPVTWHRLLDAGWGKAEDRTLRTGLWPRGHSQEGLGEKGRAPKQGGGECSLRTVGRAGGVGVDPMSV